MKIVFRKMPFAHPPVPAEGELLLCPGPDHADRRRALAQLVLDAGADALLSGAGEIHTLVVACYPTLDDMLATELVLRRLSERVVPDGIGPFATYASLLREGHTPAGVPARISVQGVFQAICSLHPPEADEPSSWPPFLEAWAPLADALFLSAGEGRDPFRDDLLSRRPEMQRDLAFLAQDQDVYRQDVLRGERWTGRIPGIDRDATALLLRKPSSALFKLWSRREPDPEAGEPITLLGISWHRGNWTFSTDPARKIPLLDLHDRLQETEDGACPDGEESREWFDGAPFDHTLVSAPEDGSRLGDDRILELVREWFGSAETARPARPRWWLVPAVLVAGIVLVSVGLWQPWKGPVEPIPTAPGPEAPTEPGGDGGRGATRTGAIDTQWGTLTYGEQHLLLIAVHDYPRDSSWSDLPGVKSDREAVFDVLTSRYVFDRIVTLYDDRASQAAIAAELDRLAKLDGTEDDSLLIYFAGHGFHDHTAKSSYWIPHDGGPESPEARNWLSHDKVHGYLNTMDFRHVLVISDACYSGAFVQERGDTLEKPVEWNLVAAYGQRSRQALMSGLDEPVRDAPVGELSPFAGPLVALLKGNAEPVLDPRDLDYHIRKAMRDAGVRQTPLFDEIPGTIHVDGSTYLFIRKTLDSGAPSIDPS